MKWRQVQQVPGDSNWRCHGMYGIWNKQCQLLQISTKVFCSAHCLQMVRRTLCQTKVSSNLWCIDVKCVNINGHTSLAFACQYFESFNITDSFIYKWDDTKFVYFVLVFSYSWSRWLVSVHYQQSYLIGCGQFLRQQPQLLH